MCVRAPCGRVTDLLRNAYATAVSGRCRGRPSSLVALVALAVLIVDLAMSQSACAQRVASPQAEPQFDVPMGGPSFDEGSWPDGQPVAPVESPSPDGFDGPPPAGWYGPPAEMQPDQYVTPGWSGECEEPPRCLRLYSCLHLRHSYTHGRNVGIGWPYVGTSWLNRPYYVGGEFGWIWITRSQEDSVTRDVDTFGGIFLGWDRDYYWGHELRFSRATPELVNAEALDAERNDVLFTCSYNLMYYPWGDAMLRPYWRWGVGGTRFDFPLDNGTRQDEWLLTFPIGVGFKFPFRPWLAGRAEFTDYLSIEHSGLPTQNNLVFTLGLEWRFGIHPRSYWPWYPSRHMW